MKRDIRRLAGLAGSILAASAGPAAAQDVAPSAWTLTRNADLTMAHTVIQSRIAVIARCGGRQLSVALQGPPNPTDNMAIDVIVDGATDLSGLWWLSNGAPMLLSREPARFVRTLSEGRSISLSGGPVEGRWLVDGPLPPDSSPLVAVLEACAVPLVDSRGPENPEFRGTFPQLDWASRPMPRWPQGPFDEGLRYGVVAVSCVTGPAGTLTDCRADAEMPLGAGFRREALRAAERARLEADTAPGRHISFDISFRLED